jgi:hypothetical protein
MKTKQLKHVPVFSNIAHQTKPLTVRICTLDGNRLGQTISAEVLADYAGNITDAIAAYDAGNAKEGERILFNWA